jgi:hypothetical protein
MPRVYSKVVLLFTIILALTPFEETGDGGIPRHFVIEDDGKLVSYYLHSKE